MKTLAEELKETSLNRAVELKNERELIALDKEKLEQDRINLIIQKTYNHFESNWLKEANKAALDGETYFSVILDERGRNVSEKDYDMTSDCRNITGVCLGDLYDIIMNKKGKDYFDTLCKQIESQGFKNVEITCRSWNGTTFSCESYTAYIIHLSAKF